MPSIGAASIDKEFATKGLLGKRPRTGASLNKSRCSAKGTYRDLESALRIAIPPLLVLASIGDIGIVADDSGQLAAAGLVFLFQLEVALNLGIRSRSSRGGTGSRRGAQVRFFRSRI